MKSLSKKLLSVAVASSIMAVVSGQAFAGSDSGIYIGGSMGSASVDYSIGDYNFDESDMGYKIFSGYNFGIIPTLNLAAEISYINFGSQESEIAGIIDTNVEIDTFTATGILGFDAGPIGFFGKMGFASWDGDLEALGNTASDSGTDPVYGVGAKFQLASLAIRTEYEVFDLEDTDVSFISLGASITF